jgi:hypothetical protein
VVVPFYLAKDRRTQSKWRVRQYCPTLSIGSQVDVGHQIAAHHDKHTLIRAALRQRKGGDMSVESRDLTGQK